LLLGCGLLFMPESPRWYVMKEKPVPARTSLAKLRDQDPQSAFVESEYQELQEVGQSKHKTIKMVVVGSIASEGVTFVEHSSAQ
jgi:hypothetical protein